MSASDDVIRTLWQGVHPGDLADVLTVAKVTLVFGLAWCALRFLRRVSASLRHLVILLALAASVLLPLLAGMLPDWGLLPGPATNAKPARAVGAQSVARGSPHPGEDLVATIPVAASSDTPVAAPPRVAVGEVTAIGRATRSEWPGRLRLIWLAGTATLVALLALRVVSIHRTVRRARQFIDPEWMQALDRARRALRISRPVALRCGGRGRMPLVWGIRRPLVVLPTDCLNWSAERRHAVLIHEMAHVARLDVPALLVSHVACAVHWFNPLCWGLHRRLALERERACDDIALERGVGASDYAEHLVSVAAAVDGPRGIAPHMARKSQLEERIMAILDSDRISRRASIAARASTIALVLVCLAPLSVIGWAAPQDEHAPAVASEPGSARFRRHLRREGYDVKDARHLATGLRSRAELTRAACAWALGQSGGRSAVMPLARTVHDESALVREWVVRSLGSLGDARALAPLVESARDESPHVREWVVRSLGKFHGEPVVPTLIKSLADSEPDVRQWSARALAIVGDRWAVPALAERLSDQHAEVRQWVVRSLASLADRNTLESLLYPLRDDDAEVQEWIVRSLGGLSVRHRDTTGSKGAAATRKRQRGETLDALFYALDSRHANVRIEAARSLARIGDERAALPLIRALGDEDARVREWAVRALGRLRDARRVLPLIERFGDRSASVREWAARALAKSADVRVIAPLERLLDDENSDVRHWAKRALDEFEVMQ